MRARMLSVLGVMAAISGCGADAGERGFQREPQVEATTAHGARVYASSFQSGRLTAIDLANGRTVSTLDVEDDAGTIGVAASRDGRTLFVTDGHPGRLRIFHARTMTLQAEREFDQRSLLLGGHPLTELSHDERFLFIGTFDYSTLESGVKVFDVRARRFVEATELASDVTLPEWPSRVNGPTFDDLSPWLGPMDDPMEAGAHVWTDRSRDGRLLAVVHGTHAWLLEGETQHVLGHARLPAFAREAHLSPDGAELVTFAGDTLQVMSTATFAVRAVPVAVPHAGPPVDIVVAAAP